MDSANGNYNRTNRSRRESFLAWIDRIVEHSTRHWSLGKFQVLLPVIGPAEEAQKKLAHLHSCFITNVRKSTTVKLERIFTDLNVLDSLDSLDAAELNMKAFNAHRGAQWRPTGNVNDDTLALNHRELLSHIAELQRQIESLQVEESRVQNELKTQHQGLQLELTVVPRVAEICEQRSKQFQGIEGGQKAFLYS
uniref:Uncharacterized protein n=1 Tax=Trichuris muris TaxID=70415 RepID=A0A5S6QQ26_TRIMR